MKKYHLIFFFFVFLNLLSFPLTSLAEENDSPDFNQVGLMDYVENLFDEGSGMVTSEANTVLQDSFGYIWIGSYGGLSRYNGNIFENISALRENAPKSGIRILFEDSRKRLWIGTNDSGLYIYEHGQFSSIDQSDNFSEEFLASLSVRSLAEDHNGRVFVGTTSGLFWADAADRLNKIPIPEIDGSTVQDLLCDVHGHMIGISSGNTVFVLDPETLTPMVVKTFTDISLGTGLMESSDGKIYLGTEEDQVLCVDLASPVQDGSISFQTLSIGSKRTVNDIYEDSQHKIWVCTDNGLGYFDHDETFCELRNLSNDTMMVQMCEDYEGNLWFASSRRGVYQLVKSKFMDISYEAGISGLTVNATILYDNCLYIGTDSGLSIMDQYGNRMHNELTEMLSGIRIRNLSKDSNGGLWIATYQKYGLIHYTAATETFTAFTTDNGMPHNQVRTSLELSDGSRAAATNGGVAIIKNGQVIQTYTSAKGIQNEVILCLSQDANGLLYAGSDGNGIFTIDTRTGEVHNITSAEGLKSGVILRMVYDPQLNGMWVSCGDQLLFLSQDGFQTITAALEGAGSIFDIKITDDYIWLLKSFGAIRTDRDYLLGGGTAYEALSKKDGLTSSLTANSWNYLSPDGMLFLCTGSGVFYININDINENAAVPKISIRQITTDHDVYWMPEDIVLPSDTQRITMELDLLTFGFASGTLTYQLDGFDKAPLTVDSRANGSVTYTNLPGGDYTFRLSGQNADGVGSEELTFQIRKEFNIMEQRYTRIFLALLFCLLLLTFYSVLLYIQKKRIQKRQQEYKALTDQTIRTVAKTIDAKDKYTIGHSHRVAAFSVEIGRRYGLKEEELEQLKYCALLHDIGKIGIPDHILNKQGRLTDEEYDTIKRHPSIGGEILKDFELAPWISVGARYHHERYDGNGYNEQLAGEEIPLYARIIAAADSYDAMNTKRIYRPQMTEEFIYHEIEKGAGSQFDPKITEILLEMIRDHFTPEAQ